jgi:hypothetical protein
MSIDFENIWGNTKTLTKILSRKRGIILPKCLIQLPSFSLSTGLGYNGEQVAKFQSHMSIDFEYIWVITKTLT